MPSETRTQGICYRHVIPEVLALRTKIYQRLEQIYLDATVTEDAFESLLDELLLLMPKNLSRRVLLDSIPNLINTPLTAPLLLATAWRLAGNLPRLRKGLAVPPWTAQRFAEWVPVQIMQARPVKLKSGMALEYQFQILAGTSCPRVMRRAWNRKVCRFLASRMGFNFRRYSANNTRPVQHRYRDPRELVGLRFLALVEPNLCSPEGPVFHKLFCGGALLEFNREQLDYRDRLKPECACPFGLPRTIPCFRCARGWENCRAGCHRQDIIFKACGRCRRDNRPFDPGISTALCLDCYEGALHT